MEAQQPPKTQTLRFVLVNSSQCHACGQSREAEPQQPQSPRLQRTQGNIEAAISRQRPLFARGLAQRQTIKPEGATVQDFGLLLDTIRRTTTLGTPLGCPEIKEKIDHIVDTATMPGVGKQLEEYGIHILKSICKQGNFQAPRMQFLDTILTEKDRRTTERFCKKMGYKRLGLGNSREMFGRSGSGLLVKFQNEAGKVIKMTVPEYLGELSNVLPGSLLAEVGQLLLNGTCEYESPQKTADTGYALLLEALKHSDGAFDAAIQLIELYVKYLEKKYDKLVPTAIKGMDEATLAHKFMECLSICVASSTNEKKWTMLLATLKTTESDANISKALIGAGYSAWTFSRLQNLVSYRGATSKTPSAELISLLFMELVEDPEHCRLYGIPEKNLHAFLIKLAVPLLTGEAIDAEDKLLNGMTNQQLFITRIYNLYLAKYFSSN